VLRPEKALELRMRRELARERGLARRPSTRVRPPAFPNAAALRYSILLRGMVAELGAAVREHLLPRMPAILAHARELERRDAPADDVEHAMARAVADYEARVNEQRIDTAVRTIAVDVAARNKAELGATLKLQTGFNPLPVAEDQQAQLEAFAKQNVKLIGSLGTEALARIEAAALRGVREGRRVEDISRDLQRELGLARSRANLIAVDQVGKLNGELTRVRQTRLGIAEYDWSTSQDERVRPHHRVLDGQRCRWDSAPVTNAAGGHNHPGGDVRCRCSAIPVVDKLLVAMGVQPPAAAPAAAPAATPQQTTSRARGARASIAKGWQAKDGGKAARAAARSFVQRSLRAVQKPALPSDDVVTVASPGPGIRASWKTDTGEMTIDPVVAQQLSEATAELAKGSGAQLTDLHRKSINTLFHETIHGHGPEIFYALSGLLVEEVVTEVLSRRTTRKLLGIKGRPQGSDVLGLPEVSKKTGQWAPVSNLLRSYDDMIAVVCSRLQVLTGWSEAKVLRVLEETAIAYKRRTDSVPRPASAARLFADVVPGLKAYERTVLATELERIGWTIK